MKLISFGMRHGKPDGKELPFGTTFTIIDIRPIFGRNPYHNRKLRKLRGTDKEVQEDILKTPSFENKYQKLLVSTKEWFDSFPDSVLYIGCTGGHHRSVYLVERLGKELNISTEHRDLDKPREEI